MPSAVLLGVFFAVPLIIIASYSLLTRGPYGGVAQPWTMENYLRLADPLYFTILLRSLVWAVAATLICIVMGVPLALFISRTGKRRNLYLALIVIPFWTSFLVRTYAWMFLLRDTGLINSGLLWLGVIQEPLPLLYNAFAVMLGLVTGYLPFLVLPVYATLERIDKSLVEAAADLGSRPLSTMFRVVIPLAMPGIRAGGVLVFVSCLGAYLTPDLMGGGKTIMIGNLIQNQFTSSRDWPFGAALSLLMMVAVTLMLLPVLRRKEEGLS
ncbi:MAG: ABC transporter permease [Candidatus Solibacter usitatus]|nr:ABC transporter permease [Candidatus Solibacter usitatus]